MVLAGYCSCPSCLLAAPLSFPLSFLPPGLCPCVTPIPVSISRSSSPYTPQEQYGLLSSDGQFRLRSLIKTLLSNSTRPCFVYGTGVLSKPRGVFGQEMFPLQSFVS